MIVVSGVLYVLYVLTPKSGLKEDLQQKIKDENNNNWFRNKAREKPLHGWNWQTEQEQIRKQHNDFGKMLEKLSFVDRIKQAKQSSNFSRRNSLGPWRASAPRGAPAARGASAPWGASTPWEASGAWAASAPWRASAPRGAPAPRGASVPWGASTPW
jgi:hypothetical protein